jgi:hypothetical protein
VTVCGLVMNVLRFIAGRETVAATTLPPKKETKTTESYIELSVMGKKSSTTDTKTLDEEDDEI